MSFCDNYQPPTPEELAAVVYQVLAALPTHRVKYDGADDSGFERPDVDMGRSRDDDEMADRAADREWAARWER